MFFGPLKDTNVPGFDKQARFKLHQSAETRETPSHELACNAANIHHSIKLKTSVSRGRDPGFPSATRGHSRIAPLDGTSAERLCRPRSGTVT